MTNLLPCPFCGLQPNLLNETGNFEIEYWDLGCPNCEAGLHRSSEAEAVKAWNSRSSSWLPISKAPKNGTRILGYGEHLEVRNSDGPIPNCHICEAFWNQESDWWQTSYQWNAAITHFQFLPEPPTVRPFDSEE